MAPSKSRHRGSKKGDTHKQRDPIMPGAFTASPDVQEPEKSAKAGASAEATPVVGGRAGAATPTVGREESSAGRGGEGLGIGLDLADGAGLEDLVIADSASVSSGSDEEVVEEEAEGSVSQTVLEAITSLQTFPNSPIPVDEFREYKSHVESQLASVQALVFRAAHEEQEAKRKVRAQRKKLKAQRLQLNTLKNKDLVGGDVQLGGTVEDAPKEDFDVKAAQRRSSSYITLTKKGPANTPVLGAARTPVIGSPEVAPPAVGGGDGFLYSPAPARALELRCAAVLLRCQVALVAKDFAKAGMLAKEAVGLAQKLEFEPLVGKCSFWKAVAEYKQRAYDDTVESLRAVRAADGVYEEAEWGRELGGLAVLRHRMAAR